MKCRCLPVTVLWSDSLLGGVCAGVWWCEEVSPMAVFERPPYKALKSSGVVLHFRWLDNLLSFPFGTCKLPVVPKEDGFRPSCVSPSRRFSWENRLWLSCRDMNLVSELLCCSCPCAANAWSSNNPCCKPNSPPTKFGRSSSISFCWPHEPAEKFNWRLNMAGKILNCWESGLAGLRPKLDGGTDELPLPLFTPPPPATVQLFLKSNLPLRWLLLYPTDEFLLFTCKDKSDGRYSLKSVKPRTRFISLKQIS